MEGLGESKLLKKIVSGTVLMLLLTGMLTLAFNIQPVKANGSIYIRADGSIDPPDAPISTLDNVTYILTGNITSDGDGVVVERSNIIIDGAGYTLQGTERSGTGISLSGRNNIAIKNANIKGFNTGIRLNSSSKNSIFENNITGNWIGVRLVYSSNDNVFSGNNIANLDYGIWLSESSNNSVSGNTITDGDYGVYFSESSNNTVSGNNISNNWYGVYLWKSANNTVSDNMFTNDGLVAVESYSNVVAGNMVNGKPLVYLEGVSGYTVEEAGQVILVNCDNIRVENLNLSFTSVGVQLSRTTNTHIANNHMTNGMRGVMLSYSSDNTVSGNNITAKNYWSQGVYLSYSSNNSVSGNNIKNNGRGVVLDKSSNNGIHKNNVTANYEYGVDLYESSNNTVSENNITANNWSGVKLWCSFNNMISGNNITANNECGVDLSSSSNNTVSGNAITNNRRSGIWLWSSSNNRFYHNNFIGNTQQVYDWSWDKPYVAPSVNVWDDGYPSGGNYWSNYTGVDLYSGPHQNITGSDGIGDTPYTIDADNTDRYHLMAPFNMFYAGTWNGTAYNIDVISNSTISDFYFNPDYGAFLRFNVTGEDGAAGFCRVAIPKDLLWVEDGWTVYVGEESVNYTIIPDNDYTYLYFTYNHSTKTVQIQGTHVIPEFPSFLILPLSMTATLFAIIVSRRKRFKHQVDFRQWWKASSKFARAITWIMNMVECA
jgi:parallel beta-helix repeat protein